MLVTAVAYPLAVTGIGQLVFEHQANGSVVRVNGAAVGSSLVGQAFVSDGYFHGRPSAAGDGYDASNSSGSNLGPTSADLRARMEAGAAAYRDENGLTADSGLPADAVTASGSGLDPHVTPANARLQAARVASARGTTESAIVALVDELTEKPAFGFIGAERVNVLELNIALDRRFPLPE